MANLMPLPKMRFTNAGRPLVGGKVFFYVAGTTTPKNTFKDRSQATANTNPVILDSNGEADIWLEVGYYKVVLKTSNDVTIWTADRIATDAGGLNVDDLIAAVNASQTAAGAAVAAVSGSVNTFFAPTKAAGDTLAASLADGATVITDEDETATPVGVQTRRTVLGGVLSAIVSFLKTGAIAWKHGGTGAVWRTLYARLMDLPVSVKDFGAVGDGVTDDTAAIQAARDFLASAPTRFKLIFPSGIYKYSVSPNWAIQDAVIEAQGEVRLRYTGTGNAVIIDSGGSGLTYNLQMGRFIVEAPSTAQNGVFVRSVHHSRLGFNVRGAGSISSGLLVSFAVCTEFENYICSVNEEGWYLGARPGAGMTLQIRNPGETVSYCTFINPIVEAPLIGIELLGTLGNVFIGGASEGCPDYGVFAASSALYDRFYGTDFEVNGIADLYILGTGIEFLNCDTFTLVNFGGTSKRCLMSGGGHESILSDTGSTANTFKDLNYNRLGSGGTFTDSGTGTEVLNVRNGGVAGSPMFLTGSVAFSAITLNPGDASVSTITVAGAKLGDFAIASGTMSLQNLTVTAIVSATDTIKVYTVNNISGAPVSVSAGTIKVRLFRGV